MVLQCDQSRGNFTFHNDNSCLERSLVMFAVSTMQLSSARLFAVTGLKVFSV
jgi:hypothetical protein